jgi:hypothetical protein
MTIKFKHGFEYKDVKYGWYQNSLYRLPYTTEKGCNYGLLKINPKVVEGKRKSNLLYRCQRDWLTSARVKTLTKEVKNWKAELVQNCEDCPFD